MTNLESFYYVLVFKKLYCNILRHYPDPSLLTASIGNKILFHVLFETDWLCCLLTCTPHLPPWGLTALSLSQRGPSISHVWFAVFITVKIHVVYEPHNPQTSIIWHLIGVLGKVWVLSLPVSPSAALPGGLSWILYLQPWVSCCGTSLTPLAAHCLSRLAARMVLHKTYLDRRAMKCLV